MYQAIVASDLGERSRDDRKTGRQVLAQLQRIDPQRELVSNERDERNVEAVSYEVRAGVERPASVEKALRGSEHEIGTADDVPFHLEDRLTRHAGELRIFVDAVIDDQALA